MTLYYITGNDSKFETAKGYFEPLGVEIIQKKLDIYEIQSDSTEEIAVDKANKAFIELKHSLIVNDSGWYITALKGFPAAYMKLVSHCFVAQDFLNLMQDKDNREVILKQVVVAVDDYGNKTVFRHETKGEMFREARGGGTNGFDQVASLTPGLTLAEERDQKKAIALDAELQLWKDVYGWIKNK
jgi:non-canonical purine NTP pyrophosphatase (RdgB/HAM1 family)